MQGDLQAFTTSFGMALLLMQPLFGACCLYRVLQDLQGPAAEGRRGAKLFDLFPQAGNKAHFIELDSTGGPIRVASCSYCSPGCMHGGRSHTHCCHHREGHPCIAGLHALLRRACPRNVPGDREVFSADPAWWDRCFDVKRHVPAGWAFAKIIHTDGVRLDALAAVHA